LKKNNIRNAESDRISFFLLCRGIGMAIFSRGLSLVPLIFEQMEALRTVWGCPRCEIDHGSGFLWLAISADLVGVGLAKEDVA